MELEKILNTKYLLETGYLAGEWQTCQNHFIHISSDNILNETKLNTSSFVDSDQCMFVYA